MQRLKDRIDELEQALGVDRSQNGRIREALKIEPLKAQIVGMLLAREFVSRDGLYTVLYGDRPECEWPEEKVLDAQICKLRPLLAKRGIEIETKWGDGWSMPSPSKSRLKQILGQCLGSLSMPSQIKVSAVESAQVADLEMRKWWGSMGGKRRAKALSNRAKKRIARHAARMRWAQRKAPIAQQA